MIAAALEMAGRYILTIKITDIIDIAVTSFLLYKILTFVLKTSSARGFKGVFVIIAAMWVSSILNLHVINFLLRKTMELGIFAIIILFQPELRRILERVGSGKLFGFFNRQMDEPKIEAALRQVIAACAEMSKTKTGALIIVEREVKLDDTIKTGTILNADTTPELLRTIFFNKTPLHDGAVIMRDGEITAAACMLPLSTNPNLSRELGMRHRAGLGISEISDAVVIIVSEETGSISVAINGMLKRHLALETFEKILRNELIPQVEVKQNAISRVKNSLKVNRNAAGKNK
jgi:diadenylate cyclase